MKKKLYPVIVSVAVAVLALVGALLTRSAALAQEASFFAKLPFVACLLALVGGLLVALTSALPARRPVDVHTLTAAAMCSALCYIGFAFFQIKIPVGDSSTSFHLGNVFCVLAALWIGGFWGGLAGAVGMTVGDLLDPVYITSAPKTFLLKLGIGLITGLVAHRLFRISRDKERKLPLVAATAISASAGMVFNIIADPLLGYFYKLYVLGMPQDAATILAKMSAVTTAVNAVIAVIAATVFYMALRPALKRSNHLPEI